MMGISNHRAESAALARLLVNMPPGMDINDLPEPWKGIAHGLISQPAGKRAGAFMAAVAELPADQREHITRSVFAADPAVAPHDTQPEPADLAGLRLTDTGNAELFTAIHGQRVRYDHRRSRWLLWSGARWQPDETGAVERLAIDTIRARYKLASEITDNARRKESVKWALSSESRSRLKSMIDLARVMEPIADPGDRWDADPWLLGCPNGVVDLRSGELRPGQPTDRITMTTGVNYDPSARAPRWEKFLSEVFDNDHELVTFIRRAAGYTLTGDNREQVLFLCWGSGANGKSTLLDTLRLALGDYASNTPFNTFELSYRRAQTNDIAALAGRRLVTAAETNEATRLNEARVKAITGGDPVTARFLFSEFFTFTPQFKVWLAMNHKPEISGSDDGIWRRIRLIPFTVSFKSKPDKTLPVTLRSELPGILAWAVAGALDWLENGLQPPRAVLAATADYREEQDLIAQFIADRLVIAPNAQVKAGDLYKDYKSWAAERGEEPLNNTRFGLRVKEHGYQTQRSAGYVWYLGLGLRIVE